MANTFKQAYFQLVFAVQLRQALIDKSWKSDLEKYITGITQNQGHKLIAINAMSDHIHILIGYNLNQLIPDLVETIKTSSNQWVKRKNFTKYQFGWQLGYGAFTYGHGQLDTIVKYVLNQEEHHMKITFQEEYVKMLKDSNIVFESKYLFDYMSD